MKRNTLGIRACSLATMFLLTVPGLLLPLGAEEGSPAPRQTTLYTYAILTYWQVPESYTMTLQAHAGANLSGPVEGVNLEITANGGVLDLPGTPVTDAGGNYTFNYTSPAVELETPVKVQLVITASKAGYDNASWTGELTVLPEPSGKAADLVPWTHALYERDYLEPVYRDVSWASIAIHRDDTLAERTVNGEVLQVNETIMILQSYEDLTNYLGTDNITNETHSLYREVSSFHSEAKGGFVATDIYEGDEQTRQHAFGPLIIGNTSKEETRTHRTVASVEDLPSSPSVGDNDTWYDLYLKETRTYTEWEDSSPPGSWWNETLWAFDTSYIEVLDTETMTVFETHYPVWKLATTGQFRGLRFDEVRYWSPDLQIDLRREYSQDDVLWFVDTLVEYDDLVEARQDLWVDFDFPHSSLPEGDRMAFVATAQTDITGPLEGVSIVLDASAGRLEMGNVTTDAEGKYRFNYTAPDINTTELDVTITVTASKSGYITVTDTIDLGILAVPQGKADTIPAYSHLKYSREYKGPKYDRNDSSAWMTVDREDIIVSGMWFGESLQVNTTKFQAFTNESQKSEEGENITFVRSIGWVNSTQYHSAVKGGYVLTKSSVDMTDINYDENRNETYRSATRLLQEKSHRPLLYTYPVSESTKVGDTADWYNLALVATSIAPQEEPGEWFNFTDWELEIWHLEVVGTTNFSIFGGLFHSLDLKLVPDPEEPGNYELLYWSLEMNAWVKREMYEENVLQYIDTMIEYDDKVETWQPPVTRTENETLPGGAVVSVVSETSGPGNVSIRATVSPVANDSQAVGVCVEISWSGDATDLSWVDITITYDETKLPAGTNENDLALYYWNASQGKWVLVPNAVLRVVNNTISARLSHLTTFAIRSKVPIVVPDLELYIGPILTKGPRVLVGAKVSLTVAGTTLTATTDSVGLARFQNVTSAWLGQNATVKVSKSGYKTLTFSGTVGQASVVPSTGTIPLVSKSPAPQKGMPGFELAFLAAALALGLLLRRERRA